MIARMDKIERRFNDLSELADQIEATCSTEDRHYASSRGRGSGATYKVYFLNGQLLEQWSTSVLTLLSRVFGRSSTTCERFIASLEVKYSNSHVRFHKLNSVFRSAKDDYLGGYLFDVRNIAAASLFDDELEQAQYFLNAGFKAPAAVVTGVVLETTLREMCTQHPDLEPSDNANRMNADLAKAGVYNAMRAKQITAWADIRNQAAHGRPEEFDEGDVHRMIDGVRDFIASSLQ
jgi:hypothetical protein